MLSKKIEFNFSNLFNKSKSDSPEEMDAQSRRLAMTEKTDLQTVVISFATGFFIVLALGALLLSIGFVID